MSAKKDAKKRKKTAAKKKAGPLNKRKKNGQFAKGHTGPGRPRGSKNKSPAKLVEKILAIEEELAAQGKGLLDCAKQDPKWFFEKLLAKVLPKNIEVGGSDEPVKFEIIRRFEVKRNPK